ncbi:MAG: hypothetical protein ACOC31_06375 [Bacteroidota bacterium]
MTKVRYKKKEDPYGHAPKNLMSEYNKPLGKKSMYAELHPSQHKKLYK